MKPKTFKIDFLCFVTILNSIIIIVLAMINFLIWNNDIVSFILMGFSFLNCFYIVLYVLIDLVKIKRNKNNLFNNKIRSKK